MKKFKERKIVNILSFNRGVDSLYFTKGGGIIPNGVSSIPLFTVLYHNGYRNDVVQSTPETKLGEYKIPTLSVQS
jgi:hypothetical protein